MQHLPLPRFVGAAALVCVAMACTTERPAAPGFVIPLPLAKSVAAADDWDKMSVDVAVEVTPGGALPPTPLAEQRIEYSLQRERRPDGVWKTVISQPIPVETEGRAQQFVRLEIADDGSESRLLGPDGRELHIPHLLASLRASGTNGPNAFGGGAPTFDAVGVRSTPTRSAQGSAASVNHWSDMLVVNSVTRSRIIERIRSRLASARAVVGTKILVTQQLPQGRIEISVDTLTGLIEEVRGNVGGVTSVTRNAYSSVDGVSLLTRVESTRHTSSGALAGPSVVIRYNNYAFSGGGK